MNIKLPSFRDTDEGLVATFPTDSTMDRLNERSIQLDSLLTALLADEHMLTLSLEIQRDLLWLASSLSKEIRQLTDAHLLAQFKEKSALIAEIDRRDMELAAHAITKHPKNPRAEKRETENA